MVARHMPKTVSPLRILANSKLERWVECTVSEQSLMRRYGEHAHIARQPVHQTRSTSSTQLFPSATARLPETPPVKQSGVYASSHAQICISNGHEQVG